MVGFFEVVQAWTAGQVILVGMESAKVC